ncbi:hypothetical protein MJI95_37220, partial [Salmonella enterica subsp. enterica serovar Kentucky]|nr:hypothetical protein [Salmonella enterica subsp. enterica serovar Kentucky]
LPRLEWRRSGGTATLRLHLHSDVSLRDDARQAKAFLASLVGIIYFISIKCQNDSVISLLSFILSLPTLPAFMPVFFMLFHNQSF